MQSGRKVMDQQSGQDIQTTTVTGVKGRFWRSRRFWLRFGLSLLGLLVIAWALLPAVRVYSLIGNNNRNHAVPPAPSDLPVQEVHFQATDGVQLAGWLVVVSPDAPTVILVHGYKGSRVDMLPWARFLYAAGYNVLLYDSRGCGESAGWNITLGTREPDDVLGAVHYLQRRADIHTKRFGALGISLGAGVVLLAAAHEPALLATVADSAWADTSEQVAWMQAISRPPFTLPLLPYGPALANALTGNNVAATSSVNVIGQIAPRAVLLIHAADDHNATTPLSGEQRLYAAAGQPKEEWIVPSGGHVGAIKVYTQAYEQHVLTFFDHYLS